MKDSNLSRAAAVAAAALLVGAATSACGVLGIGGNSAAPRLDIKDLPMEYSISEHDGKGTVLPNCQGKNAVERYGEPVSAQVFDHDEDPASIAMIVVKETDERLWDALVDAATNCETQTDVTTDPSSLATITTTVEVSVVDGPDVADKSVWVETDADTETNVAELEDIIDRTDDGPSNGLLFRSGDYVAWLTGPGTQDELAEYAEQALD